MEVYGLIGHPVGHSLSPIMHEAGFRACGIDARYVTFEPAPDAATEAVHAAASLGVRGLNVTIPFKQDVLDVVDADERALRVGAVNTIQFGPEPPRGHNTDVDGILRSFEHFDVPLTGKRAVVVGAGGAGRAAAFALAEAGADIRIVNRTKSRADALANELGEEKGYALDDIPMVLKDASVLVQTTSVGMEEDASVIPSDALHDQLTVLDAVYAPLETRLLREARAAGATTIDGGWMLLYQGVAAFELWTGGSAPVEAMNRALREALQGN